MTASLVESIKLSEIRLSVAKHDLIGVMDHSDSPHVRGEEVQRTGRRQENMNALWRFRVVAARYAEPAGQQRRGGERLCRRRFFAMPIADELKVEVDALVRQIRPPGLPFIDDKE